MGNTRNVLTRWLLCLHVDIVKCQNAPRISLVDHHFQQTRPRLAINRPTNSGRKSLERTDLGVDFNHRDCTFEPNVPYLHADPRTLEYGGKDFRHSPLDCLAAIIDASLNARQRCIHPNAGTISSGAARVPGTLLLLNDLANAGLLIFEGELVIFHINSPNRERFQANYSPKRLINRWALVREKLRTIHGNVQAIF